jgi:hypothetical protein
MVPGRRSVPPLGMYMAKTTTRIGGVMDRLQGSPHRRTQATTVTRNFWRNAQVRAGKRSAPRRSSGCIDPRPDRRAQPHLTRYAHARGPKEALAIAVRGGDTVPTNAASYLDGATAIPVPPLMAYDARGPGCTDGVHTGANATGGREPLQGPGISRGPTELERPSLLGRLPQARTNFRPPEARGSRSVGRHGDFGLRHLCDVAGLSGNAVPRRRTSGDAERNSGSVSRCGVSSFSRMYVATSPSTGLAYTDSLLQKGCTVLVFAHKQGSDFVYQHLHLLRQHRRIDTL